MSDKTIPFVITDRRKFNPDGEPRESAEPAPQASAAPEALPSPKLVEMPAPAVEPEAPQAVETAGEDETLPAAPTAEQMEQSLRAFEATADRIETAMRAANPGAEHAPALTFESLIQSVYMQAVLQLGGGTQQGEQPQIDLMGARQSIDMLGILAARTTQNLTKSEDLLLSSALFELRIAFLEMTQALARSAQQQRGPAGVGVSASGPQAGPSIVR